jgi:pimeloyl-ACP methyl ester carboxylesterase
MKNVIHRTFGLGVDALLVGALNAVHLRHGRRASSREAFEKYLQHCDGFSREEYFTPTAEMKDFRMDSPGLISWESPIATDFAANARARAMLFRVRDNAPTVVMLHALMSASDLGYRRWAKHLNALGWNAAFMHLPFHYSRRPRGYLNGELCFTSDLVRTAETLRQSVIELRQLLAWLRRTGVAEFGLIGASYGGWVGSLAGSLERDLRFLALLAPMANAEHAVFDGPTSRTIRRQLRRTGITREQVVRHARLHSPLARPPLVDFANVVIAAGEDDRLVILPDLIALSEAWPGATLLRVPQAHFGYRMMNDAVEWLTQRGLLRTMDSTAAHGSNRH